MKMKWKQFVAIPLFSTVMGCMVVAAQEPAAQQYPDPTQRAANNAPPADFRSEPFAVPLEWTPPALEQLSSQAAVKSSFTLDRTLLALAAGILPDSEADDRRALNKLDGISVHSMRFGDAGIPDERAVEAVRAAYHLRGWKHLVSTTKAGGPVHSGTTDVWLVQDGTNVRGAVVLAETPRSLTLVTVAGDLSPVDLLHLRGHFGIPRFDADGIKDDRGR
jgi:hypothetical protein